MIPIHKLSGRMGNQMFQLAYIYAQMKKGAIPDIYVQNQEYFDRYKDDIKHLFGQDIRPINQVAIHIRRGDYVNNPFYVDLTQTTYYDEAIKHFPTDKFLVFSDDIEFAKQYFTGDDFEFSEEKDEVKDFNLMAGCKGHIIANSSYSWWAAYISPYSSKVIAPKAWYADGKQRTKVPNNWLKI